MVEKLDGERIGEQVMDKRIKYVLEIVKNTGKGFETNSMWASLGICFRKSL